MDMYYANRLLDIAHSRYRPGIAIRFKDIHGFSLTKTITVEQYSESIYSVEEENQATTFHFLVDMEIGTCSCLQGYKGSECKHQAAVAKKFKIFAVNIPPFFSKEARRLFAVIARM